MMNLYCLSHPRQTTHAQPVGSKARLWLWSGAEKPKAPDHAWWGLPASPRLWASPGQETGSEPAGLACRRVSYKRGRGLRRAAGGQLACLGAARRSPPGLVSRRRSPSERGPVSPRPGLYAPTSAASACRGLAGTSDPALARGPRRPALCRMSAKRPSPCRRWA